MDTQLEGIQRLNSMVLDWSTVTEHDKLNFTLAASLKINSFVCLVIFVFRTSW